MALPELVEHGKRGGGSTRGEDAEGERGRGVAGSGRALRRTGAAEQDSRCRWVGLECGELVMQTGWATVVYFQNFSIMNMQNV